MSKIWQCQKSGRVILNLMVIETKLVTNYGGVLSYGVESKYVYGPPVSHCARTFLYMDYL